MAWHNNKRVSPPVDHGSLGWVCAKQRATKYLKQKLVELKGEGDKSTIIAEDFNIPLSTVGGTTRQKTSKDAENSVNIINEQSLTDIYGMVYQ